MADIALEAQGMTIAVGDVGSPANFQTIPEVRSIGGPDGSASWIDTTDLSSSAKEGRPGLKDEGSIRLSVHYVPDNAIHAALRDAFSNRTEKQFQITFTDTGGTTWTFNGFVLGFSVSGEVDGVLMADVTVRTSGAIVEA